MQNRPLSRSCWNNFAELILLQTESTNKDDRHLKKVIIFLSDFHIYHSKFVLRSVHLVCSASSTHWFNEKHFFIPNTSIVVNVVLRIWKTIAVLTGLSKFSFKKWMTRRSFKALPVFMYMGILIFLVSLCFSLFVFFKECVQSRL